MRHLQEKYVSVENNTFSKAQFKRDAIMECPTLVTHFNSYEEVVSILKNKSILQEIKDVEYSTSKPEDYLSPDVLDTAIRCELDDKHGTLDVSSEDYDKAKKEAIKNLTKDQLYYVNKYGEQEEASGDQMEKVTLKEDSFSTALGNALNVLNESRNEAIQNIENDERTKERISGMLTTFVSDDEEDTQRLEYAQFVNSEMEDPKNIVDYKEIMSMDDLTASYDNYLENHSEDISDLSEEAPGEEDLLASKIQKSLNKHKKDTSKVHQLKKARTALNKGDVDTAKDIANKDHLNEQDSNVVRLAQMIADEFTIEDSEGDRFSTYVNYKVGKVEDSNFELDTEATEKTPEEAAKYGTGEGWGGSFRVSPIEGGYEVRNTEKGGLVATEIDGNFRLLDAQESRAELETDFMQNRKETSDYMEIDEFDDKSTKAYGDAVKKAYGVKDRKEEEVDEVGGVDRHGHQVPVASASRFGRRDRTIRTNDKEIKEGYSSEEKRIVQLAVNKIAKYMNVSPEVALGYVIGTAEEMRSSASPKDLKEVFRKLIKEVIQD